MPFWIINATLKRYADIWSIHYRQFVPITKGEKYSTFQYTMIEEMFACSFLVGVFLAFVNRGQVKKVRNSGLIIYLTC